MRYRARATLLLVLLAALGCTKEASEPTVPSGYYDPAEHPDRLRTLSDRWRATRDIAVFHGKLDLNKCSGFEKLVIKGVKSPVGDFRDWDAISAWATDIAKTLKK